MRRQWPAERLVARLSQVHSALDQPALTSDVIVGFPGETNEDFLATCRVAEAVGFSKLHIFRFSPRQGTEAAAMPGRVPGPVQQERALQLAEIGDRLRREYFESLAGRRLQVLVESRLTSKQSPDCQKLPHCNGGLAGEIHRGAGDLLLGTSDRYAPVELPGGTDLIGRLVWVVAGRVAADRILGSAISL
jgi:threonylcarbamoyladenosine tRNA methylthiotransferase MtaB